MNANEIVAKYKQYLYGLATYYKEPLPFVTGEGKWLFDADGKKYLDFFGGIVTVGLGHCDPRVVTAIEKQARTLQHVSTLFPTIPIVELAETLAGDLPRREAGQGVLHQQRDRGHRDRHPHRAPPHAAHRDRGPAPRLPRPHRMLRMSLTAHAGWRLGGVQDPADPPRHGALLLPVPAEARVPGDCGIACAEDVEEVIKTTTSGRPAAFIAEPIMGVGGFITPPREYPAIVAEIVKRYEALYIADEVQTGWGRTGGKWFGIEQYGVKPDIIVAAKSLGNGHPDRRHDGARRGRRLVQGARPSPPSAATR